MIGHKWVVAVTPIEKLVEQQIKLSRSEQILNHKRNWIGQSQSMELFYVCGSHNSQDSCNIVYLSQAVCLQK